MGVDLDADFWRGVQIAPKLYEKCLHYGSHPLKTATITAKPDPIHDFRLDFWVKFDVFAFLWGHKAIVDFSKQLFSAPHYRTQRILRFCWF